jgi:hypothetical protein
MYVDLSESDPNVLEPRNRFEEATLPIPFHFKITRFRLNDDRPFWPRTATLTCPESFDFPTFIKQKLHLLQMKTLSFSVLPFAFSEKIPLATSHLSFNFPAQILRLKDMYLALSESCPNVL